MFLSNKHHNKVFYKIRYFFKVIIYNFTRKSSDIKSLHCIMLKDNVRQILFLRSRTATACPRKKDELQIIIRFYFQLIVAGNIICRWKIYDTQCEGLNDTVLSYYVINIYCKIFRIFNIDQLTRWELWEMKM